MSLNRPSFLAARIYDEVPELWNRQIVRPVFLKVIDHCSVCGEEFYHHRADDFPAYIVIFVVRSRHHSSGTRFGSRSDTRRRDVARVLDLAAADDHQRTGASAADEGGDRGVAMATRDARFRKSKPLRLATPQYLVCREGALHRPEAYKDVTAE